MYVLILTKIGLGYILGDFLTNLTGHPGYKLAEITFKYIHIFVRFSPVGKKRLN
jgi:hypothetical protein